MSNASGTLPMAGTLPLTGTPSQVEWADRIKAQVGKEFDRVVHSFRSVAETQDIRKRAETEVILNILQEKRADVMNRHEAGYFIREWQEISDQVRKMIGQDVRFQAIQAKRKKHNSQHIQQRPST